MCVHVYFWLMYCACMHAFVDLWALVKNPRGIREFNRIYSLRLASS